MKYKILQNVPIHMSRLIKKSNTTKKFILLTQKGIFEKNAIWPPLQIKTNLKDEEKKYFLIIFLHASNQIFYLTF